MDVAALRLQIPTTQRMVYMNTGWAGPSPTRVVESIKERLERESYEGPTSREVLDSGEAIQWKARHAIASLLNVSPFEVLLTQNTTEGLNLVMSGLPWREGDEIITCDLEHASILLTSFQIQRRLGVKVVVLSLAPDEAHSSILDKVEAALSHRTRMVFLSHIEYSCGLRMPVKEIRELTRNRGVWLLLDGAQSAGHIRLDLREIDCDFYSIPGQKWLLGPDGTGALYIKESMIPLVETTRIGGVGVEAFDHEGGYQLEPDIARYVVSTTSAPLSAGFLEAIGFVQGVGIELIEERNLALASSLAAGLSRVSGVRVLSPMEGTGRSGLVSFAIEGIDAVTVADTLWESHKILVRAVDYPSSIRASLHFFNTTQEVETVVEAVAELARGV